MVLAAELDGHVDQEGKAAQNGRATSQLSAVAGTGSKIAEKANQGKADLQEIREFLDSDKRVEFQLGSVSLQAERL